MFCKRNKMFFFFLSKRKCFASEQSFLWENKCFAIERKLMQRECKVNWGTRNTFVREFLQTNAKALRQFFLPSYIFSHYHVPWRAPKHCHLAGLMGKMKVMPDFTACIADSFTCSFGAGADPSERSFTWINYDGMGSYHGFSSKAIAELHVDNTKKTHKKISLKNLSEQKEMHAWGITIHFNMESKWLFTLITWVFFNSDPTMTFLMN